MYEESSYTSKLSSAVDAKYADYIPGDANSERRLYDALHAQAANLVHHCLEVADRDLASTIVHRAMMALADFRNESKFSTWFYTVAQNEIKRALRERITTRERFVPLTVTDRDGQERPIPIEADSDNQDARIDVERLRRRLSPKQDEILSLKADGYSLANIALKTGVPVGTVRSRYRLAKKKLKPGRARPNSRRRK